MQTPLEELAEELGLFANNVRRELKLEAAALGAEIKAELQGALRQVAEARLEIAAIEKQIAERLATLKDGKDGEPGPQGPIGLTGERGPPGPAGERGEKGEPGPPGADGADGKDGEAGPEGPPGRDGEFGERGLRGEQGERGPQGEKGMDGAPGKDGEAGPQGPAGERGQDGATWKWAGVFNNGAAYVRGDVAAMDGGCFLALQDDPGPCPGDGWRRIVERGKPGQRGERGEKGDPGRDGATLANWETDRRQYYAVPIMSDGTRGAPLPLLDLFEQYDIERA